MTAEPEVEYEIRRLVEMFEQQRTDWMQKFEGDLRSLVAAGVIDAEDAAIQLAVERAHTPRLIAQAELHLRRTILPELRAFAECGQRAGFTRH